MKHRPTLCRIRGHRRLGARVIVTVLAGSVAWGTMPPASAAAVGSVPQDITFTLPASGVAGDSLELAGTAAPGMVVSYVATTGTTCEVTGATLSLLTIGMCSVTASQAGNDTYSPAPDVVAVIDVVAAPDPSQDPAPSATPSPATSEPTQDPAPSATPSPTQDPGPTAEPSTEAPGSTEAPAILAPASAAAVAMLPGTWVQLAPAGPTPEGREGAVSAWDDANEVMWMFGGRYRSGSDLWQYDPAANAWAQVVAAGASPNLEGESVTGAWNAADQELLVLGTDDVTGATELWAFAPATESWVQRAPSGAGPQIPPGTSFTWTPRAAWDTADNRLLVFMRDSGTVHAYTPSANAWTTLNQGVTRPRAVQGVSAVWDPVDEVLLRLGTNSSGSTDLWAFSPATGLWTTLMVGGGPNPRVLSALAWDSAHNQMLAIDGVDYTLANGFDEVWSYSVALSRWKSLTPGGDRPSSRRAASIAFDPADGVAYLFGGYHPATPYGFPTDLWAYKPIGAPGAPSGASAVAGDASATVAWSPPSSDGDSAITGYTVISAPGSKTCRTSGALTCAVTNLINGTPYTFTVVATNAAGNGPVSDATAAVTPLPATTTALVSTPDPAVVLTETMLTATVSPAAATGSVAFTDVTGGGSVPLGVAILSGGTASISTAFSTVGKHDLVATYSGSASFAPSTSPPITHRVASENPIATTTSLELDLDTVPAGSTATFTATVVPSPSTGDVDWLVDGASIGTTPVGPDGRASIAAPFPDPGSFAIQARFVDGTFYDDSSSDPVTLTVSAVAYTVTLEASPDIVVTNTTTHATAFVGPIAAGTVKFYRQGSSDALLASVAVGPDGVANADLTVLSGQNSIRADFTPTGASSVRGSATVIVEGRLGTSLLLSGDPTSVVSGEGLVTLTATVPDWGVTGTVTFRDVSTGVPAVLGTAPLAEDADFNNAAVLRVRLYGAGTHAVDALYSGDPTYAPAASGQVSIQVAADTGVRASGVGLGFATFYPYKDGYRDTVAIRGTPGEPLSATVRISNSSGKTVRSWSLARRTGAWSIAWNGRTGSGAKLPAGKYKVVQTVKDDLGHKKSYTAYTTISTKRLYWYTASSTRNGEAVSAYNYSDYGSVYLSRKYAHGVTLYGDTSPDWAWVGYTFSLKSAAKYGKLSFSVLGTPKSGYGVPYISFWNFANGEEDGIRWVGRSYTWYSSAVSSTSRVSGSSKVRAYVTVLGENEGWYDLAKVRLTYRYALLK